MFKFIWVFKCGGKFFVIMTYMEIYKVVCRVWKLRHFIEVYDKFMENLVQILQNLYLRYDY